MTNMRTMVIYGAEVKHNGTSGVKSWRNFAGDAGLRNSAGNRYFTIVPTEEDARKMEAAGWPVSWKQKYGAEPGIMEPQLTVTVKYRTRDGRQMRPPKIVVISNGRQVEYGENEVSMLDNAIFENVDMQVSYYESTNPQTGLPSPKVGLDEMYVTLRNSELAEKYSRATEEAPF